MGRRIAKIKGEGNGLAQLLQRGAELITFSRSVVEGAGDGIAAGLGDGLHRGSFWQVLADEPIRVFVGAPFPGVVRRSEVDRDSRRCLDLAVAVELSAVVGGDGFEQAGVSLDQLDQFGCNVASLA